jgi:hypothetical protein
MADANIGQSVAAAWEAKVGTKPEDNVHTSHWALMNLKQSNGFKALDGGRLIEISLEIAINTTFRSYDDSETLDTTRIDVFDAAQFNWKQVAGTVVISDKEKAYTQGSGGKFDLLAGKLDNADKSHDYALNAMLFGDGTGNGSKDFGGLKLLIPTTTTSGTVGGINRATFSFWRNQATAGTKSSTAYDNLTSSMTTLYNLCSVDYDGSHPTWGVTTATLFAAYESKLVAVEQIVDKSSSDIGFKNESIRFKGMRLGWDSQMSPTDSLYMVGDTLKCYYQKGYWKKMGQPIRPANQTLDVYQIVTIGNFATSAARNLGTLYTIS